MAFDCFLKIEGFDGECTDEKHMEYVLSDVIVSAVRPGGTAQGDEPLPMEEVCFNYGKIEWSYTQTDHKTGKPNGNVAAHWDLVANKGG